MSAWSSRRHCLSAWHRGLGTASGLDLLLVPFLGAMLLVRVLTDDASSPNSRHSGSLNLSAAIALLFILLAGWLLPRRRRGLSATVLAVLWLCIWTAIAMNTSGASTETLREGVREASVVALFVIVYNARGAVTVPIATRLVQLVGFAPAIIALYQLATDTGMDVGGHLRSNGTFAHPNSAVMFFAIAATASLWRYLDYGRHRSDALLVPLFAAAVISTFSIDGLATMFAMMVAFGVLHPGPFRVKLVPYAIGVLVVLVFFATPLGAQRVSGETATGLAAAERGEGSTSLTWRIKKWKTLIPEWEASPIVGRGLGTTTTAESTFEDPYAGYPPHSEYVRYLVETGVVGLALLLAALFLLIRVLVRKRKTPGALDAGTLNAPTLALVIIVGCLVNSIADNTLLDSPTAYAAALIVAAVLALQGVGLRQVPTPQTV
jgi:O-antigen ligase